MTQERKIGDVVFRAKRPLGPCHECDANADNAWCKELNGIGEKWRPCVQSWEIADPRPTGIEAQVCADIARLQIRGTSMPERFSGGLAKELQNAYHSALKTAIALRQAISELNKTTS